MPRRRSVLRALGGATLTATLAGCTVAPPQARLDVDPLAATALDERAHAQFQGGLRNRGYVDVAMPAAVTVDWALRINRGAHTAAKSSPVTTPDGDLVVAADTGTVRRVTPEGEVVWQASVDPTQRGIHGTPAVANGTAYVGAYDGALYAFDLADGTRTWKAPLGDAIGSSPVYYNGVLYVAVEYYEPSGSVAAVDAATGDLLGADGWPTDHPHSTIALDLDVGRLVVGSNDGHLYAWTFPGLERAWTVETDRPIKGPIAVHDGVAVFGSWDGAVYGVALEDGAERFAVETGAEVMSGPAVAPDGTAYVGNHAGELLALDASTGDTDWAEDVGGAIIGALTATPDHVLVGTYGERLLAVDRESGTARWDVRSAGRVTGAPLVTDRAIYVTERRASDAEPGSLYRVLPA